MNAAGIIFLVLGIICIVVPAIITLKTDKGYFMSISIMSIVWFALFPVVNYPEPTNDDVREGKAIYIEEKNYGISATGDTLYEYRTYHLEWLPEWKYGRKQK